MIIQLDLVNTKISINTFAIREGNEGSLYGTKVRGAGNHESEVSGGSDNLNVCVGVDVSEGPCFFLFPLLIRSV